jgi:DNA-binding transcriptional regulator YiaG
MNVERPLTKKEVRAIRLVLGVKQGEWGDMLGFSKSHILRTEQANKHSYEVSIKLDRAVKDKLKQMGVNPEEVLEIARKRGLL